MHLIKEVFFVVVRLCFACRRGINNTAYNMVAYQNLPKHQYESTYHID